MVALILQNAHDDCMTIRWRMEYLRRQDALSLRLVPLFGIH